METDLYKKWVAGKSYDEIEQMKGKQMMDHLCGKPTNYTVPKPPPSPCNVKKMGHSRYMRCYQKHYWKAPSFEELMPKYCPEVKTDNKFYQLSLL